MRRCERALLHLAPPVLAGWLALAVGLFPPAVRAAPVELFISEYVEGSGSNKALEVFNGTAGPVTLTGPTTSRSSPTEARRRRRRSDLVGTVAAGDVIRVRPQRGGSGRCWRSPIS